MCIKESRQLYLNGRRKSMELKFENEKPIYIQLSEWISDLIISGK